MVDAGCDLDKAVDGVARFGIRLPGAEVLGVFARHRGRQVYDEFLEKLTRESREAHGGAVRRSAILHGSGDQRQRAQDHPQIHRRRASRKGGWSRAISRFRATATSFRRRSSPTSIRRPRIFQEEIFGPVLAVTKARDFDHALELANDSQYGLTGAVFSNNPEQFEAGPRRVLRGQSVCESQVHGRDGRGASVRRVQYVGDGFESGRSGLSAAILAGEIDCGEDVACNLHSSSTSDSIVIDLMRAASDRISWSVPVLSEL